eukprot:UN22655
MRLREEFSCKSGEDGLMPRSQSYSYCFGAWLKFSLSISHFLLRFYRYFLSIKDALCIHRNIFFVNRNWKKWFYVIVT